MEASVYFDTKISPVLLILIGAGVIGIWLKDIISGKFSSQGNFFNWVEGENRLWLHIFAEFLTGILLIASGIGILLSQTWAPKLELLGLGALIYSSINSSGWVLHKKERLPYGIPIWISLLISILIVVNLLILS